MGRNHLAAIGESNLVTVGAVAEPDAAGRAEIAAAGLLVFASVAEMLAGADLDGTLIAVPTDRHVEVLSQVMAAGVPALCEKPCGLTMAEATRCAGIAAEAGLMLQVAYWRRFVPALAQLRQRILDVTPLQLDHEDSAPAVIVGTITSVSQGIVIPTVDQQPPLEGTVSITVQVALVDRVSRRVIAGADTDGNGTPDAPATITETETFVSAYNQNVDTAADLASAVAFGRRVPVAS